MIKTKVLALSLGIFFTLSFALCIVFGLLTPAQYHMQNLLQNALPGFIWLSVGSFFLGLVESFGWGLYIGFVFGPIYNFIYKRSN